MNNSLEDAFSLLCGDLIGQGVHRKVFECKIRPDLVVKVEDDDHRFFANVFEMQFWCEYKDNKSISKWLAPCEFMSPDGRVMLQKKCSPVPFDYNLPANMPEFMCDFKRGNFGIMDGRLVCVDYGITNLKPSSKLIKTNWAI